jgi:peptide/nickel transport system permease protein
MLPRLLRNRAARWSLAVIVVLILVAIVGPHLVRYSPSEQIDIVRLANTPPSWAHPLGTDLYSHDLLSRMVSGARISLALSLLAVGLAVTIGTAYGLVSGYAGGAVDAVMMRVIDACLSMPRVLLVIALVTVWNPVPFWGLVLLMGATGWFGVSRLVRAETLILRQSVFAEAATALGAPTSRILWRHILPNVAPPIIVFAALSVGSTIVLESGLSFLGAGMRPPTASWGTIFNDWMDSPGNAWWMLVFPGIAILITVLAFNVLGDALRDVLDPRQLHGSRTAPENVTDVPSSATPSENG